MTPPSVQFIPAPVSSGLTVVSNAYIQTSVGGVENTMRADASSTIYNGWSLGVMYFRDAVKNGVWTDDGLGLLWNMVNATNYANWTGLITAGSGLFSVFEAGTSTLIFTFRWTGQGLWTTNQQRYGTTSVDYTGSVGGNNVRVDIYHA